MTEHDIIRLQAIDNQPTLIQQREHLSEDAAARRYSDKIIMALFELLQEPTADNSSQSSPLFKPLPVALFNA